MIKLMIVDDHDLVRVGLRHIIEKVRHIQVVADTGCGREALKLCREHKPDVILLDVSMPGLSGFEVTRRVMQSHPNTKIIILTVHTEAPFPARLLEAGASGYLTKACAASEMLDAIDTVARGERYIGTAVAQQLALCLLPGSQRTPFDELSAREMEVSMMLTEGTGVPAISDMLCLSPKTIATYKYRIYDKLGVRNEVELVRMAYQFGLVESAA